MSEGSGSNTAITNIQLSVFAFTIKVETAHVKMGGKYILRWFGGFVRIYFQQIIPE